MPAPPITLFSIIAQPETMSKLFERNAPPYSENDEMVYLIVLTEMVSSAELVSFCMDINPKNIVNIMPVIQSAALLVLSERELNAD